MRRNKLKLNNKGFTLLEMLLTVAIISVLMAIVMPSFTGMFSKVKATVCHANLATIKRFYTYVQVLEYDNPNDVTLTKVFNGDYDDYGLDMSTVKCPAGGTYTVIGDEIYCSIHGSVDGSTAGTGGESTGSSSETTADSGSGSDTTSGSGGGTTSGSGSGGGTTSDNGGGTTSGSGSDTSSSGGDTTTSTPVNDENIFYIDMTVYNTKYEITTWGDIETFEYKHGTEPGTNIPYGAVFYYKGDYYLFKQNQYFDDSFKSDLANKINTYGVKLDIDTIKTPSSSTEPGDIKLVDGIPYAFFPYGRYTNDYLNEAWWFQIISKVS